MYSKFKKKNAFERCFAHLYNNISAECVSN
jgi:hypothetical protein